MSEDVEKVPTMSDCAKCGKTMDFNPVDNQHQFEVECEHCHTINLVTWSIDHPGRWATSVKGG